MKDLYRRPVEIIDSIKHSYEYKVDEVNISNNEFKFHAGAKRNLRRGNIDNVAVDTKFLFLFDKNSIYQLLTAYTARRRGDVNYAKISDKNSNISDNIGWFLFLSGLYITVFLSTNIFSGRFIHVFGMTLPGGIYGFPLTFFILDIITEKFGSKAAYKLILTGILNLYLFVALVYIYYFWGPLYITPQNKETISLLNNALYRVFFYKDNIIAITVSGSIAIALSNTINCFLMNYFKIRHQSKRLWLRCLLSTFIAEGIFSITWLTIYALKTGYLPTNEIFWASASQTVVKSVYELLMLPATYFIIFMFNYNERKNVRSYS